MVGRHALSFAARAFSSTARCPGDNRRSQLTLHGPVLHRRSHSLRRGLGPRGPESGRSPGNGGQDATGNHHDDRAQHVSGTEHRNGRTRILAALARWVHGRAIHSGRHPRRRCREGMPERSQCIVQCCGGCLRVAYDDGLGAIGRHPDRHRSFPVRRLHPAGDDRRASVGKKVAVLPTEVGDRDAAVGDP